MLESRSAEVAEEHPHGRGTPLRRVELGLARGGLLQDTLHGRCGSESQVDVPDDDGLARVGVDDERLLQPQRRRRRRCRQRRSSRQLRRSLLRLVILPRLLELLEDEELA